MERFKHQNPLGRARGLGSAKSGVGTFLRERVTALALIPLGIWFVYSIISTLLQGNYASVTVWLASPISLGLMLLFIAMTFVHSAAGTQVVVEDYMNKHRLALTMMLMNKALHLICAVICLIAVLKLHLSPLAL